MDKDQIRRVVLEVFAQSAPEADLTQLPPDASLRDELDLDSMDRLNVLIALSKRIDVDIPEGDYAELATLNGCVDYLHARVQGDRRG